MYIISQFKIKGVHVTIATEGWVRQKSSETFSFNPSTAWQRLTLLISSVPHHRWFLYFITLCSRQVLSNKTIGNHGINTYLSGPNHKPPVMCGYRALKRWLVWLRICIFNLISFLINFNLNGHMCFLNNTGLYLLNECDSSCVSEWKHTNAYDWGKNHCDST